MFERTSTAPPTLHSRQEGLLVTTVAATCAVSQSLGTTAQPKPAEPKKQEQLNEATEVLLGEFGYMVYYYAGRRL